VKLVAHLSLTLDKTYVPMKALQSSEKQQLLTILITEGKLTAIKKLMLLTNCSVQDARSVINKLVGEIEPGPSNADI